VHRVENVRHGHAAHSAELPCAREDGTEFECRGCRCMHRILPGRKELFEGNFAGACAPFPRLSPRSMTSDACGCEPHPLAQAPGPSQHQQRRAQRERLPLLKLINYDLELYLPLRFNPLWSPLPLP
jgi:hypothetical protein